MDLIALLVKIPSGGTIRITACMLLACLQEYPGRVVVETLASMDLPDPLTHVLEMFVATNCVITNTMESWVASGMHIIENYLGSRERHSFGPACPVVLETLKAFGLRDPVEELACFIRRQGWKISRASGQTVEFERAYNPIDARYTPKEHAANLAILRLIAQDQYVVNALPGGGVK